MAIDNDRERLLKRTEACARLGVGLSTYKRLVREGALREISVGSLPESRGKRLPESEIDRFVRAGLKSRSTPTP